jgi:gentisate 1,2-dioxygenase
LTQVNGPIERVWHVLSNADFPKERIMTTATKRKHEQPTEAAPVKAREVMEQLNAEAGKLNVWVRTELNAPAQRAWFADTGGNSGAGELARVGRVAANQIKAVPCLWRWKDYAPFLERIEAIAKRADVSPIEFADRQSILLTNPGLGGRLQVTATMRTAISIYTPGDVAPAHVHSANASRTILTERGGYTNVEGERCEAVRGDLIITPNGTWHDHGNDSSSSVIWIDMLDWPLMEVLDCAWVDMEYRDGDKSNNKIQKTVHTDGYSGRLYGHGGLKPTFVSHQRGWGQDPDAMIHYRGADVREALHGLRKEKGDPHEGIELQFVNPVTGGPVGLTLNYAAQLLRPGEETLAKRETCSTFMVVMEGQGYTEVAGQRFDWERNDIVVMPNFLWRRHVNTGSKDAVLYTTSDASLMRNIGQYRAQGKSKDGQVIQLVQ